MSNRPSSPTASFVGFSVPDPTAVNPRKLPLWGAVHRGNKGSAWKGEAGKLYWHEKHGFQVVGVNRNGSVVFKRACDECDKITMGNDQNLCGKCGGKRAQPKTCTFVEEGGEECTNGAKYEKGTLCETHYVLKHPERRCSNGCLRPRLVSRPDGVCRTCVKGEEAEKKRKKGEELLSQLCEEKGIGVAPDNVKDAKHGVRYAKLNQYDDQLPRVVMRAGNVYRPACQNCNQLAQLNPSTGEQKWCIACGGGPRCPGPPGIGSCPYNHSAKRKEDGYQIYYDGLCCHCFCSAYPDSERAKNAKAYMHAKEQAVRDFLEKAFPRVKWVFDRRVEGTRRRPDHRPLIHGIGIESHDIVIETDENSHWFYLCADERKKEKEVHYWISRRKKPLIWVRFNPDAYDDPVTGQRVTSCFTKGGLGTTIVKPSKIEEWEQRLEKLRQVVEEYMVDHSEAWEGWAKELRPAKDTFLPIEVFYDDVLEKKGEAVAAFAAMKEAAKKKKTGKRKAGE